MNGAHQGSGDDGRDQQGPRQVAHVGPEVIALEGAVMGGRCLSTMTTGPTRKLTPKAGGGGVTQPIHHLQSWDHRCKGPRESGKKPLAYLKFTLGGRGKEEPVVFTS